MNEFDTYRPGNSYECAKLNRPDGTFAYVLSDRLGFTAVTVGGFSDYFSPEEINRLGEGDYKTGIEVVFDLATVMPSHQGEEDSPLRSEVMRRLADH